MQYGYTNPNDTEGIMDLISVGSQILLFVTGRGSVIGSPVAPLVKITGNDRNLSQSRRTTSTSTPAGCSPANARSTNLATNYSR